MHPSMVRSSRPATLCIPVLGAVVVAALTLASPTTATAGVFSFSRTDYPVASYTTGLDSVAVGDLDGKNGPDIVLESLAPIPNAGAVSVLLNNGDGTFAPAMAFDSCSGAHSIVIGQLNPSVDDHLDVAVVCGNTMIGRMLGDGQGHLAPIEPVDVGYTGVGAGTGNPYVAIVDFLRLGAMNGPTLVFGGWLASYHDFALCFFEVPQLEGALGGGITNSPFCAIATDGMGNVTDFGAVSLDLAVGPYRTYPEDTLGRDETVSFGSSQLLDVPLAITAYTPFIPSIFSYGTRAAGGATGAIALADVDGDGQNDIIMGGNDVIAEYVPGFPIDQFANPTTSFAALPELYDLATADFDGDGKLDIAAIGDDDPNDDDVTVAIYRGNGDGSFVPYEGFTAKGYTTGEVGRTAIAVADFDRDGSPDIVTTGRLEKIASVLLNGTSIGPPPSDTCATTTAFVKPKLTVKHILPPAGDDAFVFTGAFAAPPVPVDPDMHGLATTLDAGTFTVPAGAFDKATKTGWKVDKKRSKWTWSHPKDGSLGGLVKAAVVVRKGLVAIGLKGQRGDYAATPPVAITVGFPADGACGHTEFAAAACKVKGKGKTLVCT